MTETDEEYYCNDRDDEQAGDEMDEDDDDEDELEYYGIPLLGRRGSSGSSGNRGFLPAISPARHRNAEVESSRFIIPPPLPLLKFDDERAMDDGKAKTVSGIQLPTIENTFGSHKDKAWGDPLHNPVISRLLVKWFRERSNREVNYRQKDVDMGANSHTRPLTDILPAINNGTSAVAGEDAADAAVLISQSAAFDSPKFGEIADIANSCMLNETQNLVFDANFESGNLSKAVRIVGRDKLMDQTVIESLKDHVIPLSVIQEYDLLVRKDLFTDGNIQWYYFSVSTMGLPPSTEYPMRVRFNIANMQKNDALYNYGMCPAVYSSVLTPGMGWRHSGTEDVCYYKNGSSTPSATINGLNTFPKKKKRSFRMKKFYTLTFAYTFNGPDVVYFAHSFPYTYGDLQRYLQSLEQDARIATFMSRRLLSDTLAGNRCDLITITGKPAETNVANMSSSSAQPARPAIVITARVHPGETNSSFIMHGILDFLTSAAHEAEELRNHFIFKIIPMLNPDGVIHGNYRTSLSGEDLNRRYSSTDATFHPTITALKTMLKSTQQDRKIMLYLDIHGHSKLKNTFLYGCDLLQQPSFLAERAQLMYRPDDLTNRRIHSRIFPKILSVLSNSGIRNGANAGYFSYSDCNFSVSKSKFGTGRVVCWTDYRIEAAYTVEASFCGCGDNREVRILKSCDRYLATFEGHPFLSERVVLHRAPPSIGSDSSALPNVQGTSVIQGSSLLGSQAVASRRSSGSGRKMNKRLSASSPSVCADSSEVQQLQQFQQGGAVVNGALEVELADNFPEIVGRKTSLRRSSSASAAPSKSSGIAFRKKSATDVTSTNPCEPSASGMDSHPASVSAGPNIGGGYCNKSEIAAIEDYFRKFQTYRHFSKENYRDMGANICLGIFLYANLDNQNLEHEEEILDEAEDAGLLAFVAELQGRTNAQARKHSFSPGISSGGNLNSGTSPTVTRTSTPQAYSTVACSDAAVTSATDGCGRVTDDSRRQQDITAGVLDAGTQRRDSPHTNVMNSTNPSLTPIANPNTISTKTTVSSSNKVISRRSSKSAYSDSDDDFVAVNVGRDAEGGGQTTNFGAGFAARGAVDSGNNSENDDEEEDDILDKVVSGQTANAGSGTRSSADTSLQLLHSAAQETAVVDPTRFQVSAPAAPILAQPPLPTITHLDIFCPISQWCVYTSEAIEYGKRLLPILDCMHGSSISVQRGISLRFRCELDIRRELTRRNKVSETSNVRVLGNAERCGLGVPSAACPVIDAQLADTNVYSNDDGINAKFSSAVGEDINDLDDILNECMSEGAGSDSDPSVDNIPLPDIVRDSIGKDPVALLTVLTHAVDQRDQKRERMVSRLIDRQRQPKQNNKKKKKRLSVFESGTVCRDINTGTAAVNSKLSSSQFGRSYSGNNVSVKHVRPVTKQTSVFGSAYSSGTRAEVKADIVASGSNSDVDESTHSPLQLYYKSLLATTQPVKSHPPNAQSVSAASCAPASPLAKYALNLMSPTITTQAPASISSKQLSPSWAALLNPLPTADGSTVTGIPLSPNAHYYPNNVPLGMPALNSSILPITPQKVSVIALNFSNGVHNNKGKELSTSEVPGMRSGDRSIRNSSSSGSQLVHKNEAEKRNLAMISALNAAQSNTLIAGGSTTSVTGALASPQVAARHSTSAVVSRSGKRISSDSIRPVSANFKSM
jgi:hypothetical protein